MEQQKDDTSLAMACHLLGLMGFLGPLIIWLIKKDESELIDKHGRESLNFQLSIMIYFFISAMLTVVLIGFLLAPLVMIFDYVLVIVAAVRVNNGEDFQYPLSLRLIK